jgi:hypothetical protein
MPAVVSPVIVVAVVAVAVVATVLMAAPIPVVVAVVPTHGVRRPVALPVPMHRSDGLGRSRLQSDRGSDDPGDRHRRDDRLACERRDELRLLMPWMVRGTGAVQRRIGQACDVRADRPADARQQVAHLGHRQRECGEDGVDARDGEAERGRRDHAARPPRHPRSAGMLRAHLHQL